MATMSCRLAFSSSICAMRLRFASAPTARFGVAKAPRAWLAEADLCVRAARALKGATGCELGADIGVVKRIPMGAGLGGGSSDAATCLVALNQLWDLGLSAAELAAIGLEIGRGRAGIRPRPGGLCRRGRGAPDAAVPSAGARLRVTI